MRFRPAVAVLLALTACLASTDSSAQPVTRNIVFQSNMDDYTASSGLGSRYSSCWAYVHGDGREYAAIGTYEGTAIYNVTNPASPVFVKFIPGPTSLWRNIKSYRNWLYIVSEGAGALEGLQIVRMTDPDNPVHVGTYTTTFNLAHTAHVDTSRALLIANGTRQFDSGSSYLDSGTRILSLTNPESPAELTWHPGGSIPVASSQYAHDSFAMGNRLYLASIYAGRVRVLDFADSTNVSEVTSFTYPGAFTHNVWTNPARDHLYVTDEVNGRPLAVFDVSDELNPVLVNTITSNPQAIIHNAHVLGGDLHLANYTEGIRVLDISDPAHPAEFGFADSYAGPSGGFFGVWEVCPYFPSGTVIASDMQTGLYVYTLNRDYGLVRVNVVDAGSQLPLESAEVFLTTQGDSLITPADGIVQFGPSPGAHTVHGVLFGYTSDSEGVNVSMGSSDTLTLELALKPTAGFSGTVNDAVSTLALEDADVVLAYTPLSTSTNGSGAFSIAGVPDDLYRVELHSPGHVPAWFNRRIGPAFSDPQTIELTPAALYDDLESPSGWTVGDPGDDATTGIWERVEPLGTGVPPPAAAGAREAALERFFRKSPQFADRFDAQHEDEEFVGALAPGDVQPEFDRTPGAGTMCFVTGQGTDPGSIGENDVDGGRTTLTSPVLATAAMADPHVGFWRWFYRSGDANDWLAVQIRNAGGSWVAVDTLRDFRPQWEEVSIRVSDYVSLATDVQVRFVAADLGGGSIVEAAIDDLIAWDDATSTLTITPGIANRALAFRAPRPNPAPGSVVLTLDLPRAGYAEVDVYDVGGRLVRTLHRGAAAAGPLTLKWDGTGASGRMAPGGLYFARGSAGGEVARTRFVRVR